MWPLLNGWDKVEFKFRNRQSEICWYDNVQEFQNQKQRVTKFKECFFKINQDGINRNTANMLVQKLVLVLESIEKLPTLLYDGGYGIQILTKRLRFRLERAS